MDNCVKTFVLQRYVRCSTAVSNAYGDRRTMCMTAVSSVTGGRHTMNFTVIMKYCYDLRVVTIHKNGGFLIAGSHRFYGV